MALISLLGLAYLGAGQLGSLSEFLAATFHRGDANALGMGAEDLQHSFL